MMPALSFMQISIILIIGTAIGGASFALFWFFMPQAAADPGFAIKNRLRSLKGEERLSNPAANHFQEFKETILIMLGPLADNLYGKNLTYKKSIKSLLTEAGLPDNEEAIARFLSSRVISAVVGGAVGLLACLVTLQPMIYTLAGVIGGLLLGANLVQLRLRGQANQRKEEIRYKLSDVLDLMVICMEAGLGLDATLQRVGDEAAFMAPELALELKRVTKELNVGVPRIDAFHNLANRAGVEELKSLCALIIQTDKLGTSIADTLRVYADDLRVKRRHKAEELASKASIKMTFPLVLLIFPPILIVLVGPAVIQAMNTFVNHPL